MPQESCAIVLAGGASTRFGSDKLKVLIDGMSLLDRVISVASTVTPDVMVVGRVHGDIQSIDEPGEHIGPLNAMGYALAFASVDHALVLAGDHPYLHHSILDLILDLLDGHEAVVPVSHDGRPQPLVAGYHRSIRPMITDAVDRGERSIRGILNELDVRWIQPEEWTRIDPDGLSFMDIDTVSDLELLGDASIIIAEQAESHTSYLGGPGAASDDGPGAASGTASPGDTSGAGGTSSPTED